MQIKASTPSRETRRKRTGGPDFDTEQRFSSALLGRNADAQGRFSRENAAAPRLQRPKPGINVLTCFF